MVWGKTKTAISNGYGYPLGAFLAQHPEFPMKGPYGTASGTSKMRRGGALIKGSAEAKRRMAKLRAMRGKGGYSTAALRGCGEKADKFNAVCQGLSEKGTAAFYALAADMGKSLDQVINDFLTDAEKRSSMMDKIKGASKTAWRVIKRFFGFKDKDEEQERKQAEEMQLQQYLAWLKKHDKKAYKEQMKELKKRKMRELLINSGYSYLVDDDDDEIDADDADDEENNFIKQEEQKKPKKDPKIPRIKAF